MILTRLTVYSSLILNDGGIQLMVNAFIRMKQYAYFICGITSRYTFHQNRRARVYLSVLTFSLWITSAINLFIINNLNNSNLITLTEIKLNLRATLP